MHYLELRNMITTSQFFFNYWDFILPHFNYFNDSSVQFWAIIFIIPFIIHTGYIVYKDELNVANRKAIIYGLSFHTE